ncbi:MAG: ABC transporter ATP-binding protein/permease [Oscillospiraceae bacterium]|nr:ABC transporter ATP-binding protein/permease [Oscillospiraceae bacterium]
MPEVPIHTEIKMPNMGGRGGGGRNRFAPGEKPKNAKGTLLRIVGLYARFGRTVLLSIGMTAVSALVSVAIPYSIGHAFYAFHTDTITTTFTIDGTLLLQWISIIAGLYLLGYLLGTINGLVTLNVTQKLVFQLRSDFFAKLQKLPLSFFDTRSHGDTMSRLTNDVDNISSTIASTTTQLVSSVLTVLGSLVVMLVMSPILTLAVLVSVPLVALLTKFIAKRSRAYFLAQQRSLGALGGAVEENILGLKMVKAFGRRKEVLREFSDINEQLYGSSLRAQIWSGFMMPLMNVINNLTFAITAIAGGVLSVGYGLPIPVVVSFLNYSKQFGQPLNNVAGMWNTIQAALAGAERVFEIMDQTEEAPDLPDAVPADNVAGRVTFRDVCFSYAPGKPILKHIDFDVRPGETIALVGETGAGKTTVVNLLTRFYDADSGDILIDDIPITHLIRDSLRRCFSVVLQDTCLFSGTILENIRYSRPQATEEQVMAAAKLARAHDFITKLPHGYQTAVSGSTDNLSVGQRQLLAIARAVLCDCPVLILDEATSSVDTKTEKDIQRALLTLMKNHTSFLIAHRLSTIRDADRIMVIGDGEMLECGNHAQLMAKKGRYYEMVVSQMGLTVG